MEPGQSWFVVFSNQSIGAGEAGKHANFNEKRIFRVLDGPWNLEFANTKIGPAGTIRLDKLIDLSAIENDSVRYYSGSVTYTRDFKLEQLPSETMYIDLGSVSVIATVKINGTVAGTVWMSPWQVEVGELLKIGDNTISVEVANLWRNRLIYDSRLPANQRYTWVQVSDIRPGELPPSSGLLGPVTLKTEVR
jgi:hypothetical protein